ARKYQQEHANDEKPARKRRAQSKYVGVARYPDARNRWGVVVPEKYGREAEEFFGISLEDAETGSLYGDYATGRDAARGYDAFARAYMNDVPLNFPTGDEMDATGKKDERYAKFEAARNHVDAEYGGNWRLRQKNKALHERGVLPLKDG